MTTVPLRKQGSVVWLIGPGNIGIDYAKVLKEFDLRLVVIGRGKTSAKQFEEATNLSVVTGGVGAYLKTKPDIPACAIVAVQEHRLSSVATQLMQFGIRQILLEKPGALSCRKLQELIELKKQYNTQIMIAYNRRFYQSVVACREMIKRIKTEIHVHFEFTEWIHKINFDRYTKEELSRWFLCNSSHVVDLFFFLFGKPKTLHANIAGSLDWHPSGSIFSGSGVTENNIQFTYHAHWGAAGRWGLDISIPDKKLILKPLERLYIQKKGQLELEEFCRDYSLDDKFKPGLFNQVKAFLEEEKESFCTLEEQLEHFKWYDQIANYNEDHLKNNEEIL